MASTQKLAELFFEYYEASKASLASDTALVTTAYEKLLGLTGDFSNKDARIEHWVEQLQSGEVTREDFASEFLYQAANVQGDLLTDEEFALNQKVVAAIEDLDEAALTLDAATEAAQNVVTEETGSDGSDGGSDIGSQGVFTLKEARTEVELDDTMPTTTVTYWGYNPHGHGDDATQNESAIDGGVPLSDMIDVFTNIIGASFDDLDWVDGVLQSTTVDLSSVTNLTLSGADSGTTTITAELSDGSVNTAVVDLSAAHFEALYQLLFDAEGNSRLYQQEVAYTVQATDPDGNLMVDSNNDPILVPAVVEGKTVVTVEPIVLTTEQNNGGTEETGFTTAGDDTIVAGRLDLLHGAYIDGGAGNNTLEIDAKGYFAQPKELLNIQTINIENLPNVYGDNSEDYPDLEVSALVDSIVDLSRATDLEALTITEGDFDIAGQAHGDLNVTGVRGNATVTLEGAFENDVTVNFSEGAENGTNLVLNLGAVDGVLNVLHNSETLNIDSIGGGNVLGAGNLNLEGNLLNLNISGDAQLHIADSIDAAFSAGHPATIDASANTAGVDLEVSNFGDEVIFIGTAEADDHFTADDNGKSVVINGGDGNNEFSAESGIDVTITSGNGNNEVSVEDTETATVTLGDGANQVSADGVSESVTLTLGNGNNTVSAVDASDVTLTAGDGNNQIMASGESIEITTGAGDDVVIIGGEGTDHGLNGTALININLGEGNNVLALGDADNADLDGVIAQEGSTITGSNITLLVSEASDLTAIEDLSAISNVVMNDDSEVLTLTDTQFAALGAEAFSVEGSVFSTSATIKIIVTDSMSLTDLGVDSLPRNIDVQLELQDGVTLSMTAQQLHERVAADGVMLADDGNTDIANGNVVITGGGADFDPFNESDAVKSNIDGTEYVGGSLSDDFLDGGDWYNVDLDSVYQGYDRPADVEAEQVLTIDSALTPEVADLETWHTNLEITGEADVTFTETISLGLEDGTGGNAQNAFTVDFTTLTGSLNNLTLANFDAVAAVYGNNSGARINVELTDDLGDANQGLISSGVATYVVTDLDGDYNFYTCETTQDLEVLGLQGNYGREISFLNTERGVEFLMEVDYAKADGYVVGELEGAFARPGATAVVNVVGLEELPAGETQMVEGITLTNAVSATINVEGGNTEIEAFSAADLETLSLNADANLEVAGELPGDLTSVDASGVAGDLAVELGDNPEAGLTFVGAAGETTLTLNDVADEEIASIEGAGGVALVIDGTADLSATALTNVNSVTLLNGADLTISMAQADAIGAANFMIADGDLANLTLEGLNDQPFSKADFADGINLAVTLADEDVVTLHADTDLTDIASLTIPEGTTLVLTAAQFQQLDGAGVLNGDGSVEITGLTQEDAGDNGQDLDLSGIAVNGSVTVSLAESVDLSEAASVAVVDTFELGANDLTLGDVADADGTVVNGDAGSSLIFTDGVVDGGGADYIDASGFNVTYVKLSTNLVDDENVDEILGGLSGSVTKVIYGGLGEVSTIDQVATVEAGQLVNGVLAFNTLADDTEIANFTLNLEGGSQISGLDLHTTAKQDGAGNDLLRSHLQTLTIVSTGTALNQVTNTTVNVIDGDIDPSADGLGTQENNLLNVAINAEQDLDVTGEIIFNSVTGDDTITANDDDEAVATLTVDGSADVDLGGLDTSDADVVELVVNHNGEGELEFTLGANHTVETFTVNGSATGNTVIVIADDETIDLSEATLNNVDQVTLEDDSELVLNIDQLDAIGIANIVHADFDDAGDEASLSIGDYDGRGFDFNLAANDGVEVDTVTFVAGGTIVVDAAADFTGIQALNVPADTEVTLSAAQFKQLVESGALITGAGSVVVDVDADLSIGTADEATINGAEVSFDLADGVTLDVETLSLADGLQVSGDAAALVKALVNFTFQDDNEDAFADNFTDVINVAGYQDVDVRILDTLLDNFQNGGGNSQAIEELLTGLENANILNIYQEEGEGPAPQDPRDRTVVVESNAEPAGIVFSEGTVDYVRSVDLTLEADADNAALVGGNITLNDGEVRAGYTALTINAVDTDGAAVGPVGIHGDITTDGAEAGAAGELQSVEINAGVDLDITGTLTFNTEGADDYTATLTVVTTDGAEVDLGGIDGDVFATEIAINHTGDGELNLSLNGDDASVDALTFAGEGIHLTFEDGDAAAVDYSEKDLTAVESIHLENTAELTLSLAQVQALGANLTGATAEPDNTTDTLNIDMFNNGTFNVADHAGIALGTVTIDGDVTLDAGADLTGASIVVPEGSSLTLTAAQYLQLNAGDISGLGDVTVTDLTDAIAQADAPDDFDLSTVTATGTLTLQLAEDAVLGADADLGNFDVELTAGQSINFNNPGQMITTAGDPRTVTGTDTSVVEFGFTYDALDANTDGIVDVGDFSIDFGAGAGDVIGLDLSNVDVGELHVLDGLVEEQNVEQILGLLDGDVEVVVFSPEDPAAPTLGAAYVTERTVTLQANTIITDTVGDGTGDSLVFADLTDDTYLRTLTLNLEGGVDVNGTIDISTLEDLDDTQFASAFFETLTINSTDAGTNGANVLGDISATDNNLLNVTVNADSAVEIGTITFTQVGLADGVLGGEDAATATLTLEGAGDITIASLDVTDTDVDTLNIVNNSTGVVTVPGASPALSMEASDAPDSLGFSNLVLTGTGDISFGTEGDADKPGIGSTDLDSIDASGLSGNLDLGVIEGRLGNPLNLYDFEFTAGTGTTTLTLGDVTLNDAIPSDGFFAAYNAIVDALAAYNDEVTEATEAALTAAAEAINPYLLAVGEQEFASTVAADVFSDVDDSTVDLMAGLDAVGSFSDAVEAYTTALEAYNTAVAADPQVPADITAAEAPLVTAYEALQALAYLDEEGENLFAVEISDPADNATDAAAIAAAAADTTAVITAEQPTIDLELGANTTLTLTEDTTFTNGVLNITGDGTIVVAAGEEVDLSGFDVNFGADLSFDVDWDNGARLTLSREQLDALVDNEVQYQHFVVTMTLAEAMDLSYDSDTDTVLDGVSELGRMVVVQLPNNVSTNSLLENPVPLQIDASSLEFEFSENQSNTLTLAATTEINVDTLVVSGGTVDATAVPVNQLVVNGANGGGVILNSELVLTAAQFAEMQANDVLFTSETDTPSTVVVDGTVYAITGSSDDNVGGALGLEAPTQYTIDELATAVTNDEVATNFVIVDSAAHILADAENAELANAISITATSMVTEELTVADATTLADLDVTFSVFMGSDIYNIADTAANILAAIEGDVVTGADAVEATDDPAVELSVADATALLDAGVTFAVGFTLTGTVAELSAATNAVMTAADSYAVVDTKANIEAVGSPYTLLAGAAAITAQTTADPAVPEDLVLTAAQAAAFGGYYDENALPAAVADSKITGSYSIEDGIDQILAQNASGNQEADDDDRAVLTEATSLTATDIGDGEVILLTGLSAISAGTAIDFNDDAALLTEAQFEAIVVTAGLGLTAGDTVEVADDAAITLTAAQLNTVNATLAAETDGAGADATITVNTLNGATVAGTDLADTFVVDAADTGISITGFVSADDSIQLGGSDVAVALDVASIDGSENLIFDTAAKLGGNAVSIGDQSGGSAVNWAVASDTGAIYYDADGDWTAGVVVVGSVTADSLIAADFTVGGIA